MGNGASQSQLCETNPIPGSGRPEAGAVAQNKANFGNRQGSPQRHREPSAAFGRNPKTSYPQISPIRADFERKSKGEIGETTASVGPPSLLLSPSPLPLESAKICVICGFSNSFTSGDLQHVLSESLSRKQDVAPLQYRGQECKTNPIGRRVSSWRWQVAGGRYPAASVQTKPISPGGYPSVRLCYRRRIPILRRWAERLLDAVCQRV
jgi:hypothetical protein